VDRYQKFLSPANCATLNIPPQLSGATRMISEFEYGERLAKDLVHRSGGIEGGFAFRARGSSADIAEEINALFLSRPNVNQA